MTDAPDPENCLVVFNSLILQLSFQLGPRLGKGKNPRALLPDAPDYFPNSLHLPSSLTQKELLCVYEFLGNRIQ